MASPFIVDKTHRSRAWIWYAFILALFLAYSVWTVTEAFDKLDSPPTQFKLKRKTYKQPFFTVCAGDDIIWKPEWEYIKCQKIADSGDTNCAMANTSLSEEPEDQCITFNSEKSETLNSRDEYLVFDVVFNKTLASGETDISASSIMLVHETMDLDNPTVVRIPFTNIVQIFISRSEFTDLDGDTQIDYAVNVVSSQVIMPDLDESEEYSQIEVFLASLNVQVVTEKNPVSILVLFGSVSGVWGLCMALFTACYKARPGETKQLIPVWHQEGAGTDGIHKNKGLKAIAKIALDPQ